VDQFADRLARLAEMSPDEIEALEAELVAAFDAADAAGDVDLMQQLSDAIDTVRATKTATPPAEAPAEAAPVAAAADVLEVDETTAPPAAADAPAPQSAAELRALAAEAIAAAEAAEAAEAAAVVAEAEAVAAEASETAVDETPTEPTEPAEPADPAEPGPDEVPTQPTEGEPAEAATPVETAPEQEEAVASEAVVTQADVPDANKPVPVTASAPFTITAGGDIPGVTSGSRLSDMDEVIDAMTKKINAMRGVSGDGEYVVVASIRRDEETVDETKMLRRSDPEGNSAKIREFLKVNGSRESLVAAGWCAPRTPLYDIPGIGSTDTPVTDSVPSFGVDRGGIVWTEPPSLAGVITSMGANAFVRWLPGAGAGNMSQTGVTGNTPTNPADTKPCIDIACGVERSADLLALPLCLCFDLLSSRTNPEFVKAATDLVQVAQAHFKEQWVLAQMFSAPGVVNIDGAGTIGTPATSIGVARDFLTQVRVVAAQFRWRNRLGANTQVRLYAPSWLRDAIASDLMLQAPGDDTWSTSYAEVDGYLDDANVDVVWYIDDVPVMAAGTAPLGPRAATTAGSNFDSYMAFPDSAEWLITSPGVFVRMDGGSVDLGVVRTKEDVQKNKFCEFAETFESVAYMGPQNDANAWAVRGTTPIKVAGGYACCVDTSGTP
jgi:hypothetical protein